jgi:hypothetical protein
VPGDLDVRFDSLAHAWSSEQSQLSVLHSIMMFTEVRRVRRAWSLINARWPEFLRIVHLDLTSLREELVRALAGAVLGAVGGFLFMGFLSVAVIVTAWDSVHRVLVAWLICLLWAAIAAIGLAYARRVLEGPLPFGRMSAELLRDITQVKKET